MSLEGAFGEPLNTDAETRSEWGLRLVGRLYVFSNVTSPAVPGGWRRGAAGGPGFGASAKQLGLKKKKGRTFVRPFPDWVRFGLS